MEVFVDTSALLAVIDADDTAHKRAASSWKRLLRSDDQLVSTNYVMVELFAVAQRKLGIEAVRALDRDVFPLIDIAWIDSEIHRRAMAALLAASRRNLSLVDCASFEVMRMRGITRAFVFDRDFAAQGFTTVP